MRGTLIFLLFVLTTSAAIAGDTVSTDFTWWHSLSEEAKVSSTVAGTIAYDSGIFTGYNEGTDDQSAYDSKLWEMADEAVQKSEAKYVTFLDGYGKASSANKKYILYLLINKIQEDTHDAKLSYAMKYRPGADFTSRTIGELMNETDALYARHASDSKWDYSLAIECLDANLKKREFPYAKCGISFDK